MKEVSKELGFVYYCSDGKSFSREDKATEHQAQINYAMESKKYVERKLKMKAEEILKILDDNGWGVYYKSNPIHILNIQGDAAPMFSVNGVERETLSNAFSKGDERCQDSEKGLAQ